ncbi:acyltransferase [Sphingobium indicum]|uniref:Acyltransferase n=2 Tax=Sphingobium indicum TaxID=332055 RepID=A0A1L5BTY4_SPHIB|nr:acyltransferase [Sphingobium indicum]APL96328.1 acyltransferase [Sphingobium indicum B90A]KEY98028.1 acyltransferase [Sphingomonas sp. BHC-A]NYI23027.1 peptidoglycan/LPS O-acetylase OafA/YrhL [Sphingobium indicum]RYM01893.1 acyltransferase [Sphingobium indicum]
MPGPRPSSRRLTELDALRGLGALCVLVFHYSTRFHELFPQAAHVPFRFLGGNYRVLLFFAISGFAIFFTLDRIRTTADFLVNRFARLYPAYLVAMLLTLGIESLARVSQLLIGSAAILANVTMLQGFAFLPEVDGAYWTLTVEIAFYACMLSIWKYTGLRRLELLLLGWLAARWLYALWPGMPERIVMLLVLRYVPFFIIGILSYRVWAGQRSWRQQAPHAALALLSVATIDSPDMLLAGVLLLATFVALVAGRLRFLSFRPLVWMGGISYSFYLIHQHVGFVVMLKMAEAGYSPWTGFAAAFAVALVLGTLINRLVERPAGEAILRWWRNRGRSAPNEGAPSQA